MKSISSVDDIQLVICDSSELINTNSLFDSYVLSWSTAFNRQHFEDRLRWIFSFYTSTILLIDSNNTVVGGLNAHHWSTDEYALFNNLFVLPGVSDKPLSLYLINTLFTYFSKPSIGFPNHVARIPYRRCKFKTLAHFSRLIFLLIISLVHHQELPWVSLILFILLFLRFEIGRMFVGTSHCPQSSFFSKDIVIICKTGVIIR